MKRVFANLNLRKSAYVLGAAALLTLGSAKAHATTIIEEQLITALYSILILIINQGRNFH